MAKLEKIIKIGIYLAFLLPLIFTSRTMYPWHFGKTILFQVLVEILLVLALVYFSISKDRKTVRFNSLDWLVIAFVLIQIISSFFGVNFNASFWGNQQRAQGVFTWIHFTAFYFLIRNFFITKRDWLNLGKWIIIISFISSLIAWFGKYFTFFDNIIKKTPKLEGMIGNSIFFAGYLIIPVFLGFALYFMLQKKSDPHGGGRTSMRNWKWIILIIAVFNLATLLFTQVRGAFIGLIIGIFVIWLLILIFFRSKKIRNLSLSVGFLILILFSSAFIFNKKSDYLDKNFSAFSRLLRISLEENTAKTRLMAWGIALESWKDRPIFGWGPENFQDGFDKHYKAEFLKYGFAETVWDKPHNYPLEVLSTMGIFGFICYLAIITILLYYLKRIIKSSDNNHEKLSFIILAGAVIAYIAQNSFAFETSNSLMLWFVLIGFISYNYKFKKLDDNVINYKLKNSLSYLLIFIIIITPYLIYKNYTLYKASVYMGDARDAADIESLYLWQKNADKILNAKTPFLWEQAVFLTIDLNNFSAKQILDKKTMEAVLPELTDIFEKNIKKYPTSMSLRLWGGELYGLMGEHMDNKHFIRSDQLLEEALGINKERQSVGLVLAKSYLLQKRTKEAIILLEEITRKNLDYKEPHWFLGLALLQDGQKERGVEELEKGKSFGIGFKNNILYLIDIYNERKEYEKIIDLYKLLISREPDNAGYYANLAATYAALGDKDNLIINLERAVELDPNLAEEAKKFLEQNNIYLDNRQQ